MADESPDMLAQIRALNPSLSGYDDTTLAASIADQHPDYKPYLDKYLHPAAQASQALPSSGEAAAEAEKTLPTAGTPAAPAAPDVAGVQRSLERTDYGSPEVAQAISQMPAGVRQVADVGAGAAKFAQSQGTTANAAIAAGFPILGMGAAGAMLARGAIGVMSVKGAWDTLKSIPELKSLYDKGDYDELIRKGTEAGLGGLLSTLGIKYAATGHVGAAPEPEAEPPSSTPSQPEIGAQGGAGEAQIRPGEPQVGPNGEPPIVKTPEGSVKPNLPANPKQQEALLAAMRAAGVDVGDAQAQADFLAKRYDLTKPANVTSVGDVPVSESSESPTDYQYDLKGGTAGEIAGQVAHETQHARVQEGQIPEVPEGPGANDQISEQVTKDLQPIPKIAEPSNVNLDRLDISDEAKRNIMGIADEIGRQEPISRAQTIASASQLGANLDLSNAIANGTKDLHVWVESVKEYAGRTAEDYEAAKRTGDPATIDAARTTMLQAVKAGTDTLANMGRGLGAANIVSKPVSAASNASMQIAKLINEIEAGGKDAQVLKDRLDATNLSDPAQRQKLLKAAGIPGFSWRQKLGYYYVNSIISALPTWGIKTAADTAVALAAPVRTLAGGTVNRGIWEVKNRMGLEAGAQPHPLAEAQARQSSNWLAVNDALSAFAEAIKTRSLAPLAETTMGKSLVSGSNIYNREPPITGTAGKVIGTPMRVLGAITDTARHVDIRGELYEQGIREALNSGKTGADAWNYAREFANDPPEDALAAATKEAAKDTATQEPGKITKAILHLREQVPGGITQIPIVTTPQNIVKVAFESSPLGFGSIFKDLYQGNEISNAKMGRAVLGSLAWYWAFKKAQAGETTGPGPTDPREYRDLVQTGWRPKSMMTPMGWLDLRFLGPYGYGMAAAAGVAEILNDAPKAKGDTMVQKYATASADHMSRFILDQPMLQGLSEAFKTLQEPAHFPIAAGRAVGGFIPSVVARFGAAMDQSQRKIDSFGSAVASRVPFLRETLPAQRDLYGDPIPATGTPGERFASPIVRSEQSPTSPPERAYINAAIAPISGSIGLTLNGQRGNFALNPKDMEQYEILAGQRLKQSFDHLTASGSLFGNKPEAIQEQIVKNAVQGSREYARAMLISELKKNGTFQAYADSATGRILAKGQVNPYTKQLYTKGADQAMSILDRYNVPATGLPKGVPDSLADNYLEELNRARANVFYPVYTNPEELGSKDPDEAKREVEKLDEIATSLAKKETLKKAGVKSQPEAP